MCTQLYTIVHNSTKNEQHFFLQHYKTLQDSFYTNEKTLHNFHTILQKSTKTLHNSTQVYKTLQNVTKSTQLLQDSTQIYKSFQHFV